MIVGFQLTAGSPLNGVYFGYNRGFQINAESNVFIYLFIDLFLHQGRRRDH